MKPKAPTAAAKKELARLQAELKKAGPAQSPIAKARLEKLRLEIRRLKHEVENARLDSEIRRGNLMTGDDAIALALSALTSTTSWLANMPDRYFLRCNPDHPDTGRRGLEAARAELGVIVADAIKKLRPTKF